MHKKQLNKQLEIGYSNDEHRVRSYMGLELFALLAHLYLLDTVKNTEKNRDLVKRLRIR